MNRFSNNPVLYIRLVFFVMGLALVFAWSTNAHAETVSQLSIAQTGQAMVRDAIVDSISGYVIKAESRWGGSRILWTLRTTGSTSFVPRLGSAAVLKAIKPGDFINFSGTLDQGADSFVADVTYLSDTSLVNDNAAISGQVIHAYPDSGTVVVDTDSGTTTIAVNAGTIVTRGGARAEVADVAVGDTVKAWGSLNMLTDVLDADKASFSEQKVTTSGGSGTGILSRLLAWLQGSRGALSVRDR